VAYFFVDGVAERLHAGMPREAVLCAWGITEDGQKVLLHLAPGRRRTRPVVRRSSKTSNVGARPIRCWSSPTARPGSSARPRRASRARYGSGVSRVGSVTFAVGRPKPSGQRSRGGISLPPRLEQFHFNQSASSPRYPADFGLDPSGVTIAGTGIHSLAGRNSWRVFRPERGLTTTWQRRKHASPRST
jgi:hypothetical protein